MNKLRMFFLKFFDKWNVKTTDKERQVNSNKVEISGEQFFGAAHGNLKNRIFFDGDLINSYLIQHQCLLTLHAEIGEVVKLGDWDSVNEKMKLFSRALNEHLISESTRLYTYIKQVKKSSPESLVEMRGFASEMNRIGADISKCISLLQDENNTLLFSDVWAHVGRILHDRIKREEANLYPMYTEFS